MPQQEKLAGARQLRSNKNKQIFIPMPRFKEEEPKGPTQVLYPIYIHS